MLEPMEAQCKKAVDALLLKFEQLDPDIKDFEVWRAQKAARMAELKGLTEKADEFRRKALGYEDAIADLKRQRARAEDELGVVLNDLVRTRKDFETAVGKLKGLKV